MKKRKIKYYVLTFILIFFLCLLISILYLKKINPKLVILANDYMKKDVYKEITKISSSVMNNVDTSEIVNIYQNKDGEILYVNYNLKKCYKILNTVSETLNNNILVNDLIFKVPFFIYSDYALISRLGPDINIRIKYINMTLSNIQTKITNYGMNNALVEVYVTIIIDGRVITPVNKNDLEVKYDMLISSTIISGRVPSFYGSTITAFSNYFDIPISF